MLKKLFQKILIMMAKGGFILLRQNGRGRLIVNVTNMREATPVADAKVIVKRNDGSNAILEELVTDASGQTVTVELPAPGREYTEVAENEVRPYADYFLEVVAEGYEAKVIEDVQIFGDATALQGVYLNTIEQTDNTIIIPPHTLWGDYPGKIPEEEIKPLPDDSGFIVLDRPVIPEIVVVHTGIPSSYAKDYWIPFKEYIKNVASSEIYSTWPEETIKANVLAIMSFTLNRVYTEWYRGKGYDFTITNSTAYDQSFSYGRTIYQEISNVVDDLFTTYITRPGIRQPLFTQYCDGKELSCPGWLSQWGSKYLGDQGYNAIDILRNYYGSDIYLAQGEKVNGVPISYPGEVLQVGSTGNDVRTIQTQLNAISNNYPAIPKVRVDGIYGQVTREAVETFQRVFNMPQTGVVDFSTWYAISNIYVAVAKLS